MERVNIRVLRVKDKPAREALAIHRTEDDIHVIELPRHCSTRTRLHEYGHCYYDHREGTMTLRELFKREMDAEAYAYRLMGKPFEVKVFIPALYLMTDYKVRPTELLQLCKAYAVSREVNIEVGSLWKEIMIAWRTRPRT